MTDVQPAAGFDSNLKARLDLLVRFDFEGLKDEFHPYDVRDALVECRDKIRGMLKIPQQEDFADRGEDKDSPAIVTQYFHRRLAVDFAFTELFKAYFANYQ